MNTFAPYIIAKCAALDLFLSRIVRYVLQQRVYTIVFSVLACSFGIKRASATSHYGDGLTNTNNVQGFFAQMYQKFKPTEGKTPKEC